MPKGGKQPGAGRPKGSFSKETMMKIEMKNKLIERVNKEFGPLMDAAIDSAKGAFVQVKQADGTTKVYRKPPDISALKELLDRTWGKAPQAVDVTTGGEQVQGVVILPPTNDDEV